MKMTDEQFNQLDIAINDTIREFKDEIPSYVKKVFLSKNYQDFQKRILWDIFYKSASVYFKNYKKDFYNIFKDLNNEHIYTGLKKVMKNCSFLDNLIKNTKESV